MLIITTMLIENCRDKVAGSEMEGRIKQILNLYVVKAIGVSQKEILTT